MDLPILRGLCERGRRRLVPAKVGHALGRKLARDPSLALERLALRGERAAVARGRLTAAKPELDSVTLPAVLRRRRALARGLQPRPYTGSLRRRTRRTDRPTPGHESGDRAHRGRHPRADGPGQATTGLGRGRHSPPRTVSGVDGGSESLRSGQTADVPEQRT